MDTEMEFEAYSNLTSIQNFYYGQSVFLTGASGFIGKVVLEKLLRSCPGIGMIYILLRQKRGLTPEQRLEKMFKLELFKVAAEVFPAFSKRVRVIEGDITKDRLGMSFEDYEKIRQNVSIVMHCAASVNFTEPLKSATDNNLRATKNVLKLCHELSNCKVFVHVSTAFVKREEDYSVLEEIPKTKVDPEKLMDALEWLDEKSEVAVSDYLKEKVLTTYLVTKALAEVYVGEHRDDLPVTIVRPSYVGPTYKEPFPGWIDTIQGISGLLLAGAKGVLRTLQSVEGFRPSVIPVDIVSNLIVASGWHGGVTRPPPLFIMNAVFEYDKLPLAEDFLPAVLKKRDVYPLVNMFRYPDFTYYHNKYAYLLHALIDQWIPALIIDLLLFVFTGRTILTKVYKKIFILYGVFFTLGKDPWLCRTDGMKLLRRTMSEEDAEVFNINIDDFNWDAYIDICFEGGRKYLAKEDPSNIPYAKKKAYIWWAVTTTIKWFLILYFFYYLFTSSFFSPLYKTIEGKLYKIYS